MIRSPSTSQSSLASLGVAVLLVAGCGAFDTTYGRSDGMLGDQSVNGFGAFRDSLAWQPDAPELAKLAGIEQAAPSPWSMEVDSRNVSRLSSRTLREDAIVWIPETWAPANLPEITKWLESWLKSGNKTLVFIVPDDGSTRAYWQAAAGIAPPAQRLEYRRRQAQQIHKQLMEDALRTDIKLPSWFRAEALPYPIDLGDRSQVAYTLQPFVSPPPPSSPVAKKGKKSNKPVAELATELDFQPLATKFLGEPSPVAEVTTLARVTDSRWNGSQVLVVAGGGLLTNFAMTQPPARSLATAISRSIREQAARSLASGATTGSIDVGFLLSDEMPIPVSNVSPSAPRATGFELLTTWPLSLVTLHALFLGLVLCLMLLPIFGRPRTLTSDRTTQFGSHLDAMATLMQRAGGIDYARGRISQYLRTVRGETKGPWILPEPVRPVTPIAPPTLPAANDPHLQPSENLL